MGAWGAVIMSFFAAVFAAITLRLQLHWKGLVLVSPFAVFVVIIVFAAMVLGRPDYKHPGPRQARPAIMWSTIGEGVGLFIAANVVANVHHPEMLLPAMALVVGLHFLHLAYAIPFRRFYVLGSALISGAALGIIVKPPLGGIIAGFAAAGALWVASLLAIVRDRHAKRTA